MQIRFIQINTIVTNRKEEDNVLNFIKKTPAFIHSIKFKEGNLKLK